MSDRDAIRALAGKVKGIVKRNPFPNPEAPPEIVEKIGAAFDREIRMRQIGASAVAEVEEQERQEQA
ncbi:hypothetical protein LCGC14_2561760 [marine sediment metagenome]|uniref:Uncharacterized protein n=1 Tax=marine sediment metagenome TaxID=412755 RepID=A0A0F9DCZ1_9ZZZZ